VGALSAPLRLAEHAKLLGRLLPLLLLLRFSSMQQKPVLTGQEEHGEVSEQGQKVWEGPRHARHSKRLLGCGVGRVKARRGRWRWSTIGWQWVSEGVVCWVRYVSWELGAERWRQLLGQDDGSRLSRRDTSSWWV
jgi:hypothetical protein